MRRRREVGGSKLHTEGVQGQRLFYELFVSFLMALTNVLAWGRHEEESHSPKSRMTDGIKGTGGKKVCV